MLFAVLQIQEIMADAGLDAYIDTVANVRGRLASRNPTAPKLLSGSHYDTVKDAGGFDGIMGVLVPIAALKAVLVQVGCQPKFFLLEDSFTRHDAMSPYHSPHLRSA